MQTGKTGVDNLEQFSNSKLPDKGSGRGNIPERDSGHNENRNRQRKKQEKKAQKGGNTAAIAVISCSITIILALIVFLVIQFSSDEAPELVKVPDLVGENYKLHQQHSGFKIKINDYFYNDEFAKDTIIDQTPSAGTEVEKNTTIYINVSLGKQTDPQYMPDLVDIHKNKAIDQLNNLKLGLKYDIVEEYHDTIAVGRVTRTVPEQETELTADTKVTLYVSKGREIVSKSVPARILEVIQWTVGSEGEAPALSESDARELLESMDLDLIFANSVKQSNDYYKEGDVLGIVIVRKDPQNGNRTTLEGNSIDSIKTGDEITLYVSLGPECGVMPDLSEKNFDEMHLLMQDAGLKYKPIYKNNMEFAEGMVVSQSEEPGTDVPVSKIVEIVISLGPVILERIELDMPEGEIGDAEIIVMRGETEVCKLNSSDLVDGKIRLENQSGVGKVTYTILIGDGSWSREVDFGGTV